MITFVLFLVLCLLWLVCILVCIVCFCFVSFVNLAFLSLGYLFDCVVIGFWFWFCSGVFCLLFCYLCLGGYLQCLFACGFDLPDFAYCLICLLFVFAFDVYLWFALMVYFVDRVCCSCVCFRCDLIRLVCLLYGI